MGYQHDIFISYRRNAETVLWLEEHFLPLLELRVEMELGRKPAVYVDTAVESGAAWPARLGQALGTSRILLALWTRNYLSSIWCTSEFTHMVDRAQKAGLNTAAHPYGLVVPAFIHDGDSFPSTLAHIQHFEIQKCFNVRMARTSALAEELDGHLAAQAPAIVQCIDCAPPWDAAWTAMAAGRLFDELHRPPGSQAALPKFTS